MCIIITKERGAKPLPKDIFSRCWDGNPDGAGILWNDGHTTTLTKGIMNKTDFMKKVSEVNRKDICFVIHTRIKTHGSVRPENTHPFVSKTLGFAHNGVLNVQALPDTTDSETFFKWTIEDKTFEWCQENKFLLDMATNGSRCVIFNMVNGDMIHLCEEDWVKDEKYPGYMFSNRNYLPYESRQVQWYRGGCGGYASSSRDYGYSWWDDDDDYCTSQYNFDDEAVKNKTTKLEKETFDKLAKNIGLLGTKRRKDNINIEVDTVDQYLKQNCERNASTDAFADMAKMMIELKKDEKEQLEENGIASMSYISSRLIRQWFGRAKSLGYTNVYEVLIALEHYLQDLNENDDSYYNEDEKRLLEKLSADISIYTDVYLDFMDTIETTEAKDVLSNKDSKSGIQEKKSSKK